MPQIITQMFLKLLVKLYKYITFKIHHYYIGKFAETHFHCTQKLGDVLTGREALIRARRTAIAMFVR